MAEGDIEGVGVALHIIHASVKGDIGIAGDELAERCEDHEACCACDKEDGI